MSKAPSPAAALPPRALARLAEGASLTLSSVPDGFDAIAIAEIARGLAGDAETPVVATVVARDGQRAQALVRALAFVAPQIEILDFPAWDCQPYDRVSPAPQIAAQRMTTLARLARAKTSPERPRLLLTTVNAILQRVPPKARLLADSFSAQPGNVIAMDSIVQWLEVNGFLRTGTVGETGEYAVRGGIVDMWPPGLATPVRLDFFGDSLESIRAFDPETQRTTTTLRSLDFVPMSEVQLTTATIKRFRQGYATAFGAPTRDDLLYEAVSEGRRYAGLEHWLPLFHESLGTLFDYCADAPVILDALAEDAAGERLGTIKDYHDARRSQMEAPQAGIAPYRPLPPNALYLAPDEWAGARARARRVRRPPRAS
ncbi:MAG: transcription-repair coupling factor, partial [Salinarimonas sp.]